MKKESTVAAGLAGVHLVTKVRPHHDGRRSYMNN